MLLLSEVKKDNLIIIEGSQISFSKKGVGGHKRKKRGGGVTQRGKKGMGKRTEQSEGLSFLVGTGVTDPLDQRQLAEKEMA